MESKLRYTMEGVIEALETKNIQELMSFFSEDAVLIDPHFPIQNMQGKSLISCGYKWAFQVMQGIELTINNVYASGCGNAAVFELDSTYVLRTGKVLKQAQTFVVETSENKITRLQAFTSNAPKGTDGLFLRMLHLLRRCVRPKRVEAQAVSV